MTTPPQLSRRQLLRASSLGFGAVACQSLFPTLGQSADLSTPGAGLKQPHHPAKAKRVILCYMAGGVSHVDSFDPKPELARLHGEPMPVKVERTQFNQNGNVMASPFRFRRYGESGIEVSDMFPHVGGVVDELAVIRSMTTPVNEHAQGNFCMHTGFPFMGYPSAGAWCAYGLGSENENLPGYVVLQSGNAGPPHGGVPLYSNGFLPARHQGSILRADRPEALRNIQPREVGGSQSRRMELARQFDQSFLEQGGDDPQVEAAIQNYETAFRMQTAIPRLCDISDESAATRQLYGLDHTNPQLAGYGRQCLLARRLVERGVRFIELSCLAQRPESGPSANPWDQHGNLESGHREMAKQVDLPLAGLIKDLKQRGLLDETLVIWAGEFGRTPFSQGTNGRDHNPFGFSIWMAGGGVRGGVVYGGTDELGYHVVENRCEIFDLWATVLHQLGVNHQRLTYRYGGRDFRLTDVHGNILHDILA